MFQLIVGAGKGGVGKSTLSVNLGLALKDLGYKVGLLDADLYGPSVPIMLKRSDDIKNSNKPALMGGLRAITSEQFWKKEGANVVRAPVANQMIKHMLHSVDWSDTEVLIIDLPPGTGDIQLTLLQETKIDGALVVTTPQKVAVYDVQKTMQMIQGANVPIFGVVENMSCFVEPLTGIRHDLFGKGGAEQLSREFSVPMLGEIPLDPLVASSLDEGKSIFRDRSHSPGRDAIFSLATNLSRIIGSHMPSNFEVEVEDNTLCVFHEEQDPLRIDGKWLQRCCPCARCFDKEEGIFLVDPEGVEGKIVEASTLGRYAVKIIFASGCSKGIYTIDHMSEIARRLHAAC